MPAVMPADELPGNLVIDASVGLKWVVDETGSDAAVALIAGRRLVTSALFWVEAGNVLATKGRRGELHPADVADAWHDLQAVPLETVAVDAGQVHKALQLAQELSHPVYDCCYLAVALARSTVVVTADRRFARAVTVRPSLAAHLHLLAPVSGGNDRNEGAGLD